MKFYIDQGAGMEARPYDLHKITSDLQDFGVQKSYLERKFGWPNQPWVVVFHDYRNLQMYPEYARFHEWLWENGLTIATHWKG